MRTIKGETLAASYLAAGFAYISVVALVVEPQLGLAGPSDYLDPEKLSAVIREPVMIAGNMIMLGFSVALGYLAAHSSDKCFRVAGFMAALSFLVLGCLGQAAASIPALVANDARQESAQLALAAVRTAFLRTGVLSLAVVAWRSTLEQSASGTPVLWRLLGTVVLIAGFAFFFVALPVPLLFTLWAIWFTVRLAS